MREVRIAESWLSREQATFAACLATILEVPFDAVPPPAAGDEFPGSWGLMRWLGGMGMGLVSVADAAAFAWAGPWIARLRSAEGDVRGSAVMFGVPVGGVAWDPSGMTATAGWEIVDGFVVAALDIALAIPPPPATSASVGLVEAIWIASGAGADAQRCEAVRTVPGAGLDGDRHALGTGTFPSGVPGSALTLIAGEVCDSFDPPLAAGEHRRNVVTRGIDLNALVGREFTVGDVRCRGMRLCEPCVVVERYSPRSILRPLVHRGGLRADLLDEGTIRVGDSIRAI
jgi:hypothetical protein